MGMRLRSLSEDGVDAYTHIWSVAFFLLLTFVLLLVPDKRIETHVQEKPSHSLSPKYEANCWCPAQFEQSQVDYTNDVCSKTFDSELRTKGYIMPYDMMRRYRFSDVPRWRPRDATSKEEPKDIKTPSNSRITLGGLPSPVFLFILAIALRLPRMLCSIVSRCCDCVNIEQTLESAEKGDSAHYDERRPFYSCLVRAFERYTRTSGTTAAYLYVLMKLLVILVLIVEILLLAIIVLPQLQDTPPKQQDASTLDVETTTSPLPSPSPSTSPSPPSPSPSPSYDTLFNTSTVQPQIQQHEEEEEDEEGEDEIVEVEYPIYHCFFKIRQMQNVHEYRVQCSMTRKEPETQIIPTSNSAMTLNVFLIVLANMIILLVVHAVNTLLWLVNLAADSTRNRLGLGKGSSLDFVFLIQMARSNLGITVAAGLVEAACDGKSAKGDNDGQFLLEKM